VAWSLSAFSLKWRAARWCLEEIVQLDQYNAESVIPHERQFVNKEKEMWYSSLSDSFTKYADWAIQGIFAILRCIQRNDPCRMSTITKESIQFMSQSAWWMINASICKPSEMSMSNTSYREIPIMIVKVPLLRLFALLCTWVAFCLRLSHLASAALFSALHGSISLRKSRFHTLFTLLLFSTHAAREVNERLIGPLNAAPSAKIICLNIAHSQLCPKAHHVASL